jgi:hypothetical protein
VKILPWLLAGFFGLFVVILAITSLVLWGQLSSAKSDLHDANAKLTDTHSQLDDANTKLQTAQSQLDSTNQELETAKNSAEESALPEIHCRLAWASPDSGSDIRAYATLENDENTDATLTCVASRENATPKELDDVVVPAKGSYNVSVPGWTFIPGDTLTVSEPGHKSGSWTVPTSP